MLRLDDEDEDEDEKMRALSRGIWGVFIDLASSSSSPPSWP
jgi:hypothetical protein